MPVSRRSALCAALVACLSRPSLAQPAEIVKIVNGFAPGGGADTICRRLAERLMHGYAKTAFVELRTGAGGQIAIQYVKNAAPDGATVLLIPMFALGIYPHTYKKLAYDPFTDLTPVSLAATFEYAVAVGPAVPASVTTVPELMEWFRKNPTSSSLGNPASGSTAHFLGVSLARAAKIEIAHIGYRGGQPAILDMLAGQVPGVICPIGELTQYLKAGKCRVLATSGSQPSRFTPGVGTLAGQGYGDMVVKEWFGLYLPAGAAPALVEKLNAGIRTAVADPVLTESLLNMGFEPAASSPAELTAMLRTDSDRWGKLVRAIGFTADN